MTMFDRLGFGSCRGVGRCGVSLAQDQLVILVDVREFHEHKAGLYRIVGEPEVWEALRVAHVPPQHTLVADMFTSALYLFRARCPMQRLAMLRPGHHPDIFQIFRCMYVTFL